MEKLKALSPWAEVDYEDAKGINPRVDTLDGKRIGLFAHFKGHSFLILDEIQKELTKRYPTATFTVLQYPRDTSEIENDSEFLPKFEEWLDGVDTVIAAYGDAGSCAMYHAYNTAFVEKLGKPAVLVAKDSVVMSARRGASARICPELRIVVAPESLPDMSFVPALDQELIDTVIHPNVVAIMDDIVDALLAPLTEEEQAIPHSVANPFAEEVVEGTAQEINDIFYERGYTQGLPMAIPTEEAVSEMLRGADLPRDYVVAKLPPMLGKATVEKIAVNAVMAGCLPIHMPVLIAAVEAMNDPIIHLAGWTCSVAGFAPALCVNGPVARALNMNTNEAVLSMYFKSNACLARALAYIIQNISGSRPGLEDNAYMGHEGRFWTVLAEDEANSPWEPLQTEYGFTEDDSTVFLYWYHDRAIFRGNRNVNYLLEKMCSYDNTWGFDPGCTFVITAGMAKILADAGYSRDDVREYIYEYARKSSDTINKRWMTDNNHMPKSGLPLPEKGCYSARKYWTKEHINIIVSGVAPIDRGVAQIGGGDHGGPACIKIRLPRNWDELVAEYASQVADPQFIRY